ncbi:hypothetical protein [Natronospora cellulosivora (SeqCode)]
MKKRFNLLLIISVVIFTLTACSNPQGGFGPSWDISLRLPMAESQSTTVKEVFEEAAIGGLDLEGDLVKYTYDDELISFNFGDELVEALDDEFHGMDISAEFELDAIDLGNVLNGYSDDIPIPGGVNSDDLSDYDLSEIDPIDLEGFESIEFSEGKLSLLISSEVEYVIDEIVLELDFGNGTLEELTYENIPGHAINFNPEEAYIDLRGRKLENEIALRVIRINTSQGPLDSEDNIRFTYSVDDAIVNKVNRYEGKIDTSINIDEIELNFFEFDDYDLAAIGFEAGQIVVDIDSPNALDLEVTSISIGDIAANSKNISVEGKTLSMDNLSLTDLEIKITGENFDYDSNERLSVYVSFEDVEVASIDFQSLDLSNFIGDDFVQTISDIPELGELDNFALNDLKIELRINNNSSWILDLSSLSLKAFENASKTLAFTLGDIDADSSYIDNSENAMTSISLVSEIETDFLDILMSNPDYIEIDMSTLSIVNSDTVSIAKGDSLAIGINFEIGLDITLYEDFTFELEPIEIPELSHSDKEFIENNLLKSSYVQFSTLDNQLGIEPELRLYLASIKDASLMTSQELAEELYQEKNLFLTNVISNGSNGEERMIIINEEMFDKLLESNLYFGVELFIEKGEIRISPEGYIKMEDIVTVIDAKVNY